MKTLNFKTNITDHDSMLAVTQALNGIEPIDGWNLDLGDPDKLLTIQTIDNRIGEQVTQALARAGFRAEPVD
ncbi:copper chaperone [Hymenobacter taeanensis]|uniref:Copper chaperone n=1 Tax=Hymenobacter taeanensis TaxID=2735321 RepID=A0A6M6BEG0_9BACT|nr:MULTISPECIES: copper chaperone [Hymenobacter]QJX46248.1 copper chaperone [Hymenobacter taeanensis]UOQ80102.1 copper chaperone [Hymenobacter sp. 5414T-23]